MFEFYGGVTHVIVPHCLRQGVLNCHLYDPDLNPGYAKDRALIEGLLVKILMRYVRFRHRRQRFIYLPQINIALRECVVRINSRPHSRIGVSRLKRFELIGKPL